MLKNHCRLNRLVEGPPLSMRLLTVTSGLVQLHLNLNLTSLRSPVKAYGSFHLRLYP